MIIYYNWNTKHVDYTNTFAQEYFREEFYIDPPRGFGGYDIISKMLRLIIKKFCGIR